MPNPILLLAFCFYGFLAVLSGCGTTRLKGAVKLLPTTVRLEGTPHISFVGEHPTVKPDTNKFPKPPTEKQVKEMLNQSYQLNFDQLLAPEFKKLNSLVKEQGNALQSSEYNNKQLTDIIINMRLRSIKRTDSMNTVLFRERQAREKVETRMVDEQKRQIMRNAEQLNSLNTLADILLTAGVIMIVCIIVLIVVARLLWKKVFELSKQFANV